MSKQLGFWEVNPIDVKTHFQESLYFEISDRKRCSLMYLSCKCAKILGNESKGDSRILGAELGQQIAQQQTAVIRLRVWKRKPVPKRFLCFAVSFISLILRVYTMVKVWRSDTWIEIILIALKLHMSFNLYQKKKKLQLESPSELSHQHRVHFKWSKRQCFILRLLCMPALLRHKSTLHCVRAVLIGLT